MGLIKGDIGSLGYGSTEVFLRRSGPFERDIQGYNRDRTGYIEIYADQCVQNIGPSSFFFGRGGGGPHIID